MLDFVTAAQAGDFQLNSEKLAIEKLARSGALITTGLQKNIKRHRDAMSDSLETLQILIPLSPSDAVRCFRSLPQLESIAGPDDLPSRICSIIAVDCDARYEQLVTAFSLLQGAMKN